GEVVQIDRPVAVGGPVARRVDRAGGDRHRAGQGDGLPARGGLGTRTGGGQQRAGRGPEAHRVRGRGAGGLVEADRRDGARDVGGEADAEVVRRRGVARVDGRGRRRVTPEARRRRTAVAE